MANQQQQNYPRRKGPIGGLISLIGTGVGAATEYHAHRKERKAAHEASLSPPVDDAVAGPSTSRSPGTSPGAPPAYASTASPGERQQDSKRGYGDDKKAAGDYGDDSDTDSDDSDLATPEEDDEEAWYLDEVAAAGEPPSYETATGEDTSEDALSLIHI